MTAIASPTVNAIHPGVSQSVSIGGTSTKSNLLQAATEVVQLVATVACFVQCGANPTAVVNTSMYIPANVPVLVGVTPGGYVAVIGTSGTLYITEAQ